MKKTISLIAVLTCIACISQAASFEWGSGRTQFGIGSFVIDGSVMGHLVILGMTAENTDSITGKILTNPEVATSQSTSSGVGKGKIGSTYTADMGTSIGDGVGRMEDNAVFGMYLTHTDGTGQDWINASSMTYTIDKLADDGSDLTPATFDFAWNVNEKGATFTAGGGWYAVPEPSIGLLALAGIGMLIRRKRA